MDVEIGRKAGAAIPNDVLSSLSKLIDFKLGMRSLSRRKRFLFQIGTLHVKSTRFPDVFVLEFALLNFEN